MSQNVKDYIKNLEKNIAWLQKKIDEVDTQKAKLQEIIDKLKA